MDICGLLLCFAVSPLWTNCQYLLLLCCLLGSRYFSVWIQTISDIVVSLSPSSHQLRWCKYCWWCDICYYLDYRPLGSWLLFFIGFSSIIIDMELRIFGFVFTWYDPWLYISMFVNYFKLITWYFMLYFKELSWGKKKSVCHLNRKSLYMFVSIEYDVEWSHGTNGFQKV